MKRTKMKDCIHDLNTLIGFLGKPRSDQNLKAFISEFIPPPEITVDKEDDADYEFIEFKAHGFGLAFYDDILQSFHLQSGKAVDDYSKYDLSLPMGISFEESKSELLARLPAPDVEGGGQNGFFGYVPDWVRYDNGDGHAVHVQFANGTENIGMVTVMLLKNE
jgi:hypothetical protein